jgi:hypothetical protein
LGETLTNTRIVSYLSFNDSIATDCRSQAVFLDAQSAVKDAISNNSFRACLAFQCESEFNRSVKDVR